MHIPDGLISPQTYLPALAVAVPLWWWAARAFTRQVGDEALPRLAVFTALAFVLSSLMLPLPGGTSGHAIGVGLLALVFGPWVRFLPTPSCWCCRRWSWARAASPHCP